MFNFDKRILYIILGVFVLVNIVGRLNSTDSILTLLLTLPAILIAITFHEFAHAFAADKLGDSTPRNQGRLTLNPIKHIDPFGFALLIIAGFGWGKPVQVNPRNFKRNITMTKGEAIVSFAGPLMNLVLAFVSAIIFAICVKYDLLANMTIRARFLVQIFLLELVLINVGLGLFNLIPLPPLDGSKVLSGFLPYKADMWFKNNEQIFYIIFLVLWITGLAGTFISPAIIDVYNALIGLVGAIFKISM